MEQLLIVNSAKALNAGSSVTAYDFSGLDAGAISFFECGGDKTANTLLSAAPTKNFGIVLGRGAGKAPFMIPEIDISTLEIGHTIPYAGATFAASFTFPTPVKGKEYTVVLIKKGTVLNECPTRHVGIVAGSTTTNTEAAAMRSAINAKTNDLFPFVATGSNATVTITCQNPGEDWEIKFADELAGTSTSALTHGKKAVGDKAYIQDLASRCAAGKGFNLLAEDGKELYPGYSEAIEDDITMNTSGSGNSSTTGYKIFNLHFATKRDAGKQLNERIWQYVHIAIPLTKVDGSTASSALSGLNAILPEGKFSDNATRNAIAGASASTTEPGTGFLTKAVADTLYDPLE